MDKLIEKHLNVTDMSFYPLEQAEKYANITKDIACGFAEWCWKSGWCRSSKWDGIIYWFNHSVSSQSIPSSELFDLYLKSL